jgi:hypothetical protein
MILTIISVVFLCFIIILYLLLSLGFPLGFLAMGGRDLGVLPKEKRVQTLVSIPAQVFAIYVLLSLSGVVFEKTILITIFGVVYSLFFTANVVMNILSKSKYERVIMTPIAFVVASSFVYQMIRLFSS